MSSVFIWCLTLLCLHNLLNIVKYNISCTIYGGEMNKEEFILIGEIVTAVGIKGEVKIYSYSNNESNYLKNTSLFIDNNKNIRAIKIEDTRIHKGLPIIKFDGIDNRDDAELMVGNKLYIKSDNLGELPENTYYIKDLMGCVVYDNNNEIIGEITDVLQNSAQDLYKIKTKGGKEILIPVVKEFVKRIDIDEKSIYVDLIPGFLE